jgi:uncharacterized FAD-dependent dehydrogenase
MSRLVQLNLNPERASEEAEIRKIAGTLTGIPPSHIKGIRILKRSVDARKPNIRVNLTVEVLSGDDPVSPQLSPFIPQDVAGRPEVIIAGAGPAGLFAALRLLELGLRPVIIERGKDISSRKKDIAAINREHLVNPESNYCFGEGGAGTYSDRKLYTRSKKRGDNSRVLELLCIHGADENILYEAHPHLGTDKLPAIITNIRKSIIDTGGIFLLGKKVTDFIIESDSVKGVVVSENEKFDTSSLILATGHSARDIYEICRRRNVDIEMKPLRWE